MDNDGILSFGGKDYPIKGPVKFNFAAMEGKIKLACEGLPLSVLTGDLSFKVQPWQVARMKRIFAENFKKGHDAGASSRPQGFYFLPPYDRD